MSDQPTQMYVVMRWISDGSAKPWPLTVTAEKQIADAIAEVASKTYSYDILIQAVPVWPRVSEVEP